MGYKKISKDLKRSRRNERGYFCCEKIRSRPIKHIQVEKIRYRSKAERVHKRVSQTSCQRKGS